MNLKVIKDLRKEKHLTKKKLSELSGVGRMVIHRMEENGNGKFEDVQKVFLVLGYEIKLMRV